MFCRISDGKNPKPVGELDSEIEALSIVGDLGNMITADGRDLWSLLQPGLF
jgi:hypothetical protein